VKVYLGVLGPVILNIQAI